MNNEPFRSEKHVITVSIKGNKYKVCQVIFNKRDGSVFVNLPYFRHSKGIVSLITYPGNIGQNVDLSFKPGGNITSHRVKYSHHPDGRVHFSQDGQVKTVIRKMSVPLTKLRGHMFTLCIQGLI